MRQHIHIVTDGSAIGNPGPGGWAAVLSCGRSRHLADRWLRQGWRNTRGRPLRDQALWQTLLILRAKHFVEWRWVRGHDGHPKQTEADALAYMEARRQWLAQRLAA
jgi:ribonuclease HI